MEKMRILVWKEDDTWIAHALECNLFASAKDIESLSKEFSRITDFHIKHSLKTHRNPFCTLVKPPIDVYFRFESAQLLKYDQFLKIDHSLLPLPHTEVRIHSNEQ